MITSEGIERGATCPICQSDMDIENTIEFPRSAIDCKRASNADTKYQIKIDGKGVDYKVSNNVNARILSEFKYDNK